MLPYQTKISQQHVLPGYHGGEVNLTNTDKTTVIYFFAPWCQVCHYSIDNLQSHYINNSDINVIAVALDYIDKKEVGDFVAQHQLTFPIAMGNETIKSAYNIFAYPSYYVINSKNEVVAKSVGYSTELGLYLRTLSLLNDS